MLRSLTIRDPVIVHVLGLNPADGFIVSTGEMGVGRSILTDALVLTLGERVDVAIVCEGAPRADVTVESDVYPYVTAWLETYELYDNKDVTLLHRIINAVGRSRAFINGVIAVLA